MKHLLKFAGEISPYLKGFFTAIVLEALILYFITSAYPNESLLSTIQESVLFLGVLGVVFTAIQASIASKTYRYISTPILLHTGFFDFFDSDGRPNGSPEFIPIKNVGKRLCYNIRGWCVNKNKLYRLVFGVQLQSPTPEGIKNLFRGDYQRVWMENNDSIDTTIIVPYEGSASDSIDHFILLYDDNEGSTYFSLLTRSYKYTTGFLNVWEKLKICRIINMPYSKFRYSNNLVSAT